MTPLAQLRKYSAELVDLHHALALMQWDQEVRMPRLAGEDRASQFATLSALVHRREVAPELGGLLAEVDARKEGLSVEDLALLRVMRRSYEQNTRLPEEFVAEFSRLTSQAQMRWVEAREQSDFSIFQPLLERLVVLSRQQAEYLGYAVHPYDALLDLHEEGLTTAQVAEMFAELQAPLVAMVKKFSDRLSPLSFDEPFSLTGQEQFAEHLLGAMGFDFSRGCLARSAHPFTTTLGHHDRRITNRYAPKSLDFIFGALHEGGHALYEQGIDGRLAHTHLDDGVSLGIHESQSRFWENVVGRGRPFWQRFFPELQQAFPAQFSHIGIEEFVRGINAVTPGLIRVDADEVTYNLHVLVRFEIEKGLIEGSLEVGDLPGIWREKYREYLGVEVPSDAEGVLQDIHWSHGSFGYFPTYTIGNLASAQIWEAYKQYDPDFQQTLAAGNLSKVREWLVREIHAHGSVYLPQELLVRVTGAPLSAQPFLGYLAEKFSALIG